MTALQFYDGKLTLSGAISSNRGVISIAAFMPEFNAKSARTLVNHARGEFVRKNVVNDQNNIRKYQKAVSGFEHCESYVANLVAHDFPDLEGDVNDSSLCQQCDAVSRTVLLKSSGCRICGWKMVPEVPPTLQILSVEQSMLTALKILETISQDRLSEQIRRNLAQVAAQECKFTLKLLNRLQ